jgi:hypothetical protein
MSVTVICVFSNGCGGCDYYKTHLHKQNSMLFSRLGLVQVECTAKSLIEGLKKEDTPYAFLTQVKIFPTILLVRTDILQLYKEEALKEDIFNRCFGYNTVILGPGYEPRIRSITPQVYGISTEDFERFYKDFLITPAFTLEISTGHVQTRDAATHSKDQVIGRGYNQAIRIPTQTRQSNTRTMAERGRNVGCVTVRPVRIIRK